MKEILIIVTIVVVVGFLGYQLFGKQEKNDPGLVSNKGSGVKVGADLLAALATLDTLKLDTEFFRDQTFRRLVNFSKEIPVQPKGRSNPFAPLGSANLPTAATSTANTQ